MVSGVLKVGKFPTHGQIVEEFGQGVDLNVSGFINSAPFTIKVILNNNECKRFYHN